MSEETGVFPTPLDDYNKILIDNAHPENYTNPEPAKKYTLVVLGAGSAGLTAAAAISGLGGKVALIEKHFMGGDCLNVGCVPSKSLIRTAKVIGELKHAKKLGVDVDGFQVNFQRAMERVRSVRSTISHHDSVSRFQKLGVDVFFGTPSFSSKDTIEVDGKTLKFYRCLIATGGRPLVIPIPGLKEVGYLTNENIFNLEELPPSLAIIGAGPIGCELAQTFARLGSKVTVFDIASNVLPREDPEASAVVKASLLEDGVVFQLGAKIEKVSQEVEGGVKVLSFKDSDGKDQETGVSDILMAVGRVPNTEGLNVDAAGVKLTERKHVQTNDYLQTSNPQVYAAGDVTLKYQFTHAAGHAAGVFIQNSIFAKLPGTKRKHTSMVMPWCTYTSPAIAHVGKYAHELDKEGTAYDVFKVNMSGNDRALADDETEGFVKMVVAKGKDTILGCTIVAKQAGEMIPEVTFAMTNGLGLSSFNNVIHCYPTQSEAIHRVAGEYRKSRLTDSRKKLIQKLFL